MMVITFDTDWVPQFVLDHVLDILSSFSLKATFFCTGPYDGLESNRYEVALHPNLMSDSTQGRSEKAVIANLKSTLPEAIGIRTHRLYWHGGMFSLLKHNGITYDSSLLLPLQPYLAPFRQNGLIRFPIWWSERVLCDSGSSFNGFNPPGLEATGLKVLLFHPIHIYANTRDFAAMRQGLEKIGALEKANAAKFDSFRQDGKGMETVFMSSLERIASEQDKTFTLEELTHEVS